MTSRGSIGNRRFSHSKKSNKKRNLKYERTINMKLHTLILISILVICIGHLPNIKAVSPAPDGGYPGRQLRQKGKTPFLTLQVARCNTAVGSFSLESLTTGSFNTGIGADTLFVKHRRRQYGHRRCSALAQHHRCQQYGRRNSHACQ